MRNKLLIGIAAAAIIYLAFFINSSYAEKKKFDDLYRQVELFSDALAIIESEYVDEVKYKDLIYGALKGMLSSLDPHSQFMDPETYNELKVDTQGKFGGLGIEITMKDGLLTVVTPIEDTPAWIAGIKSNDRIVKIDNELTRDMMLTDAVKKLRGKPHEPVTITVLRESEKKILEFTIVRDIIKVKDIKEARILEDGIAYIRLAEFRENTPNELRVNLDRLKKEGMSALILDLRNNPGGLLDVSVKVAEEFLEKGKMVVYTKSRKNSQDLEFTAQEPNPILELPMIILINEGSASGSEIVAGAFQDYKRAIILGTKSFGKGSVQTVIPLRDNSALRLTTSKYFTPLGQQIHGKGITPDITVEEGRIELTAQEELIPDIKQGIFEQVGNSKDKNKKEGKPVKNEKKPDYRSDNQLMRAVDLFKALRVYRPNK